MTTATKSRTKRVTRGEKHVLCVWKMSEHDQIGRVTNISFILDVLLLLSFFFFFFFFKSVLNCNL